MSPIRIALVDQNALLRESLCACFSNHPDFEVVWTADSTIEAVEKVKTVEPDVALIEAELREGDAFVLARKMTTDGHRSKVIILTNNTCDAFIEQTIDLNLGGYILKGETLDVVILSIVRVFNGEQIYSSGIKKKLRFDPATNNYQFSSHSRLSVLTERQLQILKYLALGASAKEVARELHLSTKAVNSHKYRIMRRLNIHDRVQLARFAIREGLTHA